MALSRMQRLLNDIYQAPPRIMDLSVPVRVTEIVAQWVQDSEFDLVLPTDPGPDASEDLRLLWEHRDTLTGFEQQYRRFVAWVHLNRLLERLDELGVLRLGQHVLDLHDRLDDTRELGQQTADTVREVVWATKSKLEGRP